MTAQEALKTLETFAEEKYEAGRGLRTALDTLQLLVTRCEQDEDQTALARFVCDKLRARSASRLLGLSELIQEIKEEYRKGTT